MTITHRVKRILVAGEPVYPSDAPLPDPITTIEIDGALYAIPVPKEGDEIDVEFEFDYPPQLERL